jgi:hypothetical protein
MLLYGYQNDTYRSERERESRREMRKKRLNYFLRIFLSKKREQRVDGGKEERGRGRAVGVTYPPTTKVSLNTFFFSAGFRRLGSEVLNVRAFPTRLSQKLVQPDLLSTIFPPPPLSIFQRGCLV